MSIAVAIEQIHERIYKKHNGEITLVSYAGKMHDNKSLFVCKNGHSWNASTASVIHKVGCSECSKEKQRKKLAYGFSYVKEKIEEKNCTLISKEYVNTKEQIEIKYFCGHIEKTSFGSFLAAKFNLCKKCVSEKLRELERISYEKELFKMIESMKFHSASFPNGYKNRLSYIEYFCEKNHHNRKKVREFLKSKTCIECVKIKVSESLRGDKSSFWKGGENYKYISAYFKKSISQWKRDSAKAGNYLCRITGKRMEVIHHLYNFRKILSDALFELSLPVHDNVSKYTQEELSLIVQKIQEIHYRHPLGVCLTKKVHWLFHKIYGGYDNTPEQFFEFEIKIKSGEIKI